MIPRFSLIRPRSLAEAFAALDGTNGDAAWYAGGTELLQVMKMGLAQFETLIDIKPILELRGIAVEPDGTLRIGATVTHRQIEDSPVIAASLPGLVALEAHVANIRVRNQGTIGGNLAFAEPHSDPATYLLACAGRVELVGPGSRRELGIDEFVLGPLYTAREPDEILTAIRVPARQTAEGRAYEKVKFFERPAVSVAVRLRVEGGLIADCTIAIGSMTDIPMLVPEAGAVFIGEAADGRDLDGPVRRATDLIGQLDAVDDLNGSPDYKRHLAGVLLGRAARTALAEAATNA